MYYQAKSSASNIAQTTKLQLLDTKNAGQSLIELLVALVILGIISCYAMSSMSLLHRKNALQKTADEIKQAIYFAKTEAVINAHTVTLTPLLEQGNWSLGMRLFIDNNLHHYIKDSPFIRVWSWNHKAIRISWHGFESEHYLRFSPDLLERTANGYFIIQDDLNNSVKIVLNRLARVVEQRTPAAVSIHHNIVGLRSPGATQ